MGENLEIVRELYDSFRARDNARAFELYSPDIVWEGGGTAILGMDSRYEGHEGVKRFWREWLAAWSDIEWDREEITELDDGRIRAVIRNQRNRGRETGIWVNSRDYQQLWTLEEGKVTRVDFEWLE